MAGMRTDEVVRVIVEQNNNDVDENLVDEVTARKENWPRSTSQRGPTSRWS